VVATRLEGDLIALAETHAAEAEAATVGRLEDPPPETRVTIVAVLCAAAALEAFINQEAHDREPTWWESNERLSLDKKWSRLIELKTGSAPDRGGGWFHELVALSDARNVIAHDNGVRRGTEASLSGPPVATPWGKISATRAALDAKLARRSVVAARTAVREFYSAMGEEIPDFATGWVQLGGRRSQRGDGGAMHPRTGTLLPALTHDDPRSGPTGASRERDRSGG
jgi:hypothetical protein